MIELPDISPDQTGDVRMIKIMEPAKLVNNSDESSWPICSKSLGRTSNLIMFNSATPVKGS